MNHAEKLAAQLVAAIRSLDAAFNAHRDHPACSPECPYPNACRRFDAALAACVAAGVRLSSQDWRTT